MQFEHKKIIQITIVNISDNLFIKKKECVSSQMLFIYLDVKHMCYLREAI